MLKVFFVAILVSFSAQADLSQSACTKLLKETAKLVAIANDRFSVGEVNTADVASAELEYLEVKFDCRAIFFADYCDQAAATVETLVVVTQELEKTGQAELADVARAQKKQAVVEGLCK